MRHSFRKVFSCACLLLSLPVAALADTIQGKVAAAGPSAIAVVVYDERGVPYPNTLTLKVDGGTRLEGVSSPEELRKKDPVELEVSRQETGLWRADAIRLLPDTPGVQVAAPKPASAPLSDALGNPVIRGGITGAITGAVASGASGGKAGKGALIGAGAGAAAGLLGNLFSSSSRTQSSDDNRSG